MKKDLPPVSALVAFEAAGRLQSFTRAAEELNVTQAAISRQIRLLEENLGCRLFSRAHRAVTLTMEGRDYLHTIVNALTHVGIASRELRENVPLARLTVAADQAMASLWLMPRLQRLAAAGGDPGIRLVVSDDDRKLLAGEVDLAVIHGDGNWPTHDAALLFTDRVVPVCSPAYRRKMPETVQAAGLAGESLIELEDEHWNWLNWRQWLTSHGVSLSAGPDRLTIDSYPLVIDAARRGMGLALGWRGLIDEIGRAHV